MDDRRIVVFTKLLLDFMFYCGIVVFFTLPFSMRYVEAHYLPQIEAWYLQMLVVYGGSGLFGILIIQRLRMMMRTVIANSCFVFENVRSLEIMAVLSLCIAVLFVFQLFFWPTFASVVLILVFFIAALFSQVLSFVFAQAVRYKEENDLTI